MDHTPLNAATRGIEQGGAQQAERYLEDALSPATRRAYRSDWLAFAAWCTERALEPLPASPEIVARYLSALGDTHKAATLRRKVASISVAHKAAGFATPCSAIVVRMMLRGIARNHGSAQQRKLPVRVTHLRKVCPLLGDSPIEVRDRALLLLGYAGAFRRSELAALDVEDLKQVPEGLLVTVKRSKNDPEGRGQVKAVPFGQRPETCPVRAVQAWLEMRGPEAGPLLSRVLKGGTLTRRRLSSKAVGSAVKRWAIVMGLERAEVGGHSLRAGLVTDAFAAGVPEAAIMAQTGHRSYSVLAGYRREADPFGKNAAGAVGL